MSKSKYSETYSSNILGANGLKLSLCLIFSFTTSLIFSFLGCSTATDRATFQPIGDAYVDPARPDRIATSVPAEPLVFFLLDPEISSGSANIANIVLDGNGLEIVVGQPGGS